MTGPLPPPSSKCRARCASTSPPKASRVFRNCCSFRNTSVTKRRVFCSAERCPPPTRTSSCCEPPKRRPGRARSGCDRSSDKLHPPAALLGCRQIVAGQEFGEPPPLGRCLGVPTNEMAGRKLHAPVPQQRSQATPVQPATRFPVHPDGHHRIAVVGILRDLIGDHREQPPMLARRGQLQHAVAAGLEHV